jgi:hypothetical protein
MVVMARRSVDAVGSITFSTRKVYKMDGDSDQHKEPQYIEERADNSGLRLDAEAPLNTEEEKDDNFAASSGRTVDIPSENIKRAKFILGSHMAVVENLQILSVSLQKLGFGVTEASARIVFLASLANLAVRTQEHIELLTSWQEDTFNMIKIVIDILMAESEVPLVLTTTHNIDIIADTTTKEQDGDTGSKDEVKKSRFRSLIQSSADESMNENNLYDENSHPGESSPETSHQLPKKSKRRPFTTVTKQTKIQFKIKGSTKGFRKLFHVPKKHYTARSEPETVDSY